MKIKLILIMLALLTFTACKEAANTETTEVETTVDTEVEMTDNTDLFNTRLGIIRSFVEAHSKEDLEAQGALLADTLKWSPPGYSDSPWIGKDEYLAALKGYHDNFSDITYTEGIVMPNQTGPGYFSGNHYSSDGTVNSGANAIRCYGTWKATHDESGKSIGVKWFGVVSFNEDNKIAMMTEYWNVDGLEAQISGD